MICNTYQQISITFLFYFFIKFLKNQNYHDDTHYLILIFTIFKIMFAICKRVLFRSTIDLKTTSCHVIV